MADALLLTLSQLSLHDDTADATSLTLPSLSLSNDILGVMSLCKLFCTPILHTLCSQPSVDLSGLGGSDRFHTWVYFPLHLATKTCTHHQCRLVLVPMHSWCCLLALTHYCQPTQTSDTKLTNFQLYTWSLESLTTVSTLKLIEINKQQSDSISNTNIKLSTDKPINRPTNRQSYPPTNHQSTNS